MTQERSYHGLTIWINCICGKRHEFDEPYFPCYFKCEDSEEQTIWFDPDDPLWIESLEEAKNEAEENDSELTILED